MTASKVTSELQISAMSFLKAVAHFGSEGEPKPDFMKGKCDYVRTPITRDGMRTLFKTQGSLATRIAITCDSYGGSISDVAPDATAFAHRAGTLFSMKYSTHWKKASETRARVSDVKVLHESMREHVSGFSYFNYCDLDLKDYAHAYWGSNLVQLKKVKAIYDPSNFFKHAQSIPLPE
jgi:Berberine and berberine like